MTLRLAALLPLALLFAPPPAPAAERAWQKGRVLDSQRSRYLAGRVTDRERPSRTGRRGKETQRDVYHTQQIVVIRGDTHTFETRQRAQYLWSKLANITVNADIRVVMEKDKLVILDDDEKEHTLEIIRKVLRRPQ